MSSLMDKLVKHAGDMMADKSSLEGGADKKEDKVGDFLSIFKKDKEEDDDDHKGGLFSFGKDKDTHKNKDNGNFFDKLFNKDDGDREKAPKDRAGPEDMAPGCGPCDHMSEEDLDLMSDLMEVAKESS